MTDKSGIVRNPLTIIAIFAGLAETSGTAVLPLLDHHIQEIYVWFLMSFPAILLILFFSVLYFKHEVLYAPSDFPNPELFAKFVPARSQLYEEFHSFDTFVPATTRVAQDSEKSEVVPDQSEKEETEVGNDTFPPLDTQQLRDHRVMKILRREWIIDYISIKSDTSFNRSVVLVENSGIYIDGIGVSGHKQYMLMILDIYDNQNIYINIFKFIMEIDALKRSFSAAQEKSNIIVPCISIVGAERHVKSDLFDRIRNYIDPDKLTMTIYIFEFESNEALVRQIDVIGHSSIPGISSGPP